MRGPGGRRCVMVIVGSSPVAWRGPRTGPDSARRKTVSPTQLLLKAYYERLHERMGEGRDRLLARVDELLPAQIAKQGFGAMAGQLCLVTGQFQHVIQHFSN